MRLLIISTWYPTNKSTAGSFIEMQALALLGKGVKVTIMLHQYQSFGSYLKKSKRKNYRKNNLLTFLDINTVLLPFIPSNSWLNKLLIQFHVTLRIIGLRIGIIHHHGIINNVYITSFLSKWLRIPYVFTEHSPYSQTDEISFHNPYDKIETAKSFINLANTRIAVSAHYAHLYNKLYNNTFIVIHNVVSKFFEEPKAQTPTKSTFSYLAIGNLDVGKNHELLLRAFSKVYDSDKNIKLEIAGEGPLRPFLMSLVKELDLSNNVVFLGNLDRVQIRNKLDVSDVLMISSLKETFGVVAIEAFFRGKPVLSTKCGGPEELINNNNGLLSDLDLDQYTEKMKEIKNISKNYNVEEIKRNAIKLYREANISKQLIQVYEKLNNN